MDTRVPCTLSTCGRRKERAMVNALQVSKLGARERIAPGVVARFEDGMVVLSVPLPDWAGAQGARS
jgi:hypothetical protein